MIGYRVPGCFQTALICGLGLWFSWLGCLFPSATATAADNQVWELSPTLRIEETRVPGSDLSSWPEGNWFPVPLKKYQSLKRAALVKKNTPPNSWIQEATYTATLKGDQLVDGKLNYVMHCSRSERGFIDLSQLNLAVHELKWGNQDAVWGLAPDQKSLLLVDHFNEALTGQWSLKGRQLPQRTEFTFQLPETVVSRVQLKLPRGMFLTTSVGYVTGPRPSEDSQFDLWQIELGGQSQFQAIIHQAEKIKNAPTQILYHQFAQAGIREDGLRLREDFQIEVLNTPVQKLVFSAPAGYDIYSVTLGNDLALPFELQKTSEQTLMTVDLIDPLIGISRPLTVRALASPSLDSAIVIPRLKLQQAHFLGGTIHLDISSPLETHAISFTDLRQTGVLIQEEQGEAYDFKQYAPDARLVYRLSLPDLNLSARVHSLIQVEEKAWKLTSRIHWSSAAGSTYRLESMIPSGWEITQVSSPAETNSAAIVWDVEESDQQQKLSIRLPVSVSPEAPFVLEIQARRLVPVSNRQIELSGIRPLGCSSVDRILELSTPNQLALQFDPDKEVEDLTPSELPKSWKFPAVRQENSRFFHLSPYSGARWGTLRQSSMEQTFQVNASTFLALNDDLIQENYILNCVPPARGIQRVMVYLSEEGKPLEWTLPSDSSLQAKLKIQKLPVSEHQKWYLPNLGELWELSFPAPVFKELEIRGERNRPFQKTVRAALVFAPQAQPFQGIVRVLNSNELNLRMKTEGLLLPPDIQDRSRFPRNQRNYEWEYQQPLGALTITRSSEMPENSLDQGTATVSIHSHFGHGNGEPDVHEAVIALDLSKTFDDKFLFRFPREVKLISTTVNGRRVTPVEVDKQYLIPLFDQLDSYQITIQYQTTSSADFLTTTRQIPFPQISQRVLETEWKFVLPAGVQLMEGPLNMVLQQSLPAESLTRRFLGVLGKPHHNAGANRSEWDAIVLFPVKSGILEIANAGNIRLFSWVILLVTVTIGLMLRIWSVNHRDKICIMGILISMILSWVFPFVWAEISGSCLAGILIVLLIPRRFLRQEVQRQIEDESTKAYQHSLSSVSLTARILLAGVLGITATGYAQKSPALNLPAEGNQSVAVQTEYVLLPDSSRTGSESFAYLTPGLLQVLEEFVADPEPPAYLITSAEYAGDIRDNQLLTVNADFRVKIPVTRTSSVIQLPINGGNLSGPDSCRVDGKVIPVLLSADGQSILVNVSNELNHRPRVSSDPNGPLEARKPVFDHSYQEHHIELVLHPAVKISPGSGQFELSIPPLATNHFSFDFHDAVQLVELSESTGSSRYQLSGQKHFSTYLKETSQLKVKWFMGQSSQVSPLNLEAAVLINADVASSMTRLDVQVKYNVLNGKVDYLSWKLPAGMIVRSVKSPGISIIPALHPTAGRQSENLLLELSESKSGEFLINAVFELPADDSLQDVMIPPVYFGSDHLETQSATIKITSQQIGVRTGPEFEIEQSGTLPEGVTSISAKAPGRQPEDNILKSATLLFQMAQPAPISLSLKSKNPDRSARITQSLVVNQKSIDWTFSAELRISQAPAFRHILTIPAALRIESLSVKEEDVERLAHWHRAGNQITLFLKNKTSGLQDLTLKGWLPVRSMGHMKIPEIQIEQTRIEDTQLTLHQKPQLEVKLTSPEFRRVQDDTAQPSSVEHLTFVGRFQATDSKSNVIELSIKPHNMLISADSLTMVDVLEDQKIEVTQTLRFTIPDPEMQITLLIPQEYTENYTIDGMPFELAGQSPEGSLLVHLLPPDSRTKEKSISVRATVLKPAQELVIAPVTLENSKIQKHYLLLSSQLEFQLSDKKKRKTIQPEKVPDWVQARCDISPDFSRERVFPGSNRPWKLNSTLSDTDVASEEFIPYMESEIILSNPEVIHGLTQIKLFNQTSRSLKLSWPAKTKLMAVLINGENDTTLEQKDGALSIPLNGGPKFYELTLFWESYQIEHEYFLEKAWLQLPQPVNFPLTHNLVQIVSSNHHRTFLSQEVTPFTYFSDQLEAELKVAEVELELADQSNVSQSTWQAILKSLKQLEMIVADPDLNRQGISETLNRFAALKDRVFVFKQYVRSGDDEILPTPSFFAQFHQKLKPVAQQKIHYFSRAGSFDPEEELLSAWIMPDLYLNLLLAAIGLIVLLPILGKTVQARSADWLNTHPAFALLLLGLIWLLFFSPELIGLVIIAISVVMAVRQKQEISSGDQQSVMSTPASQE
ncbi:hypothetical protein [Gimesia sp.]|uniref:hypothetical protein n=1 Tax=Gimesia sp. TaxID=2024833 RepID=UPI003A91896F